MLRKNGSRSCKRATPLSSFQCSCSLAYWNHTTQHARACFQSDAVRGEFGKSSAALRWYRTAHPARTQTSSAPRDINTIRGRKCGNPQQRAPSLNTNNCRPSLTIRRALSSQRCSFMYNREKIWIYIADIRCALIEEENLLGFGMKRREKNGRIPKIKSYFWSFSGAQAFRLRLFSEALVWATNYYFHSRPKSAIRLSAAAWKRELCAWMLLLIWKRITA